jgi:glutamate/tyrosine decarboxylase-like PLP-dependent enzyme
MAMDTADDRERLQDRRSPLEMTPDQFRTIGYEVVDRIADLLGTMRQRPVTPAEDPGSVRALLEDTGLPEDGSDPQRLLSETADLLLGHSLFNGHPRFWGYVTSSAAPIGALADLLAAGVNPNVGAWALAPIASAIEEQTVRWIAELIGYPSDCGGLLVSGGNMANFIGFLAARKATLSWDVRTSGVAGGDGNKLRVYASAETHTWVQKAADLFGLGTDAICWLPVDGSRRVDPAALRAAIDQDRARHLTPFLIIGTAGTVSTGAVDPLPELAAVAREHNLWFHVDGAYGGLAALLFGGDEQVPVPDDLAGLREADSIAIDPHKWLYAPLEAGCALVRRKAALLDAFSYHPAYYHFDEQGAAPAINYYEHGPQNSRGFRALKVWLALKQVGRRGYQRMLADDIRLAIELYRRVQDEPELQACTQSLSITTFRYVPADLRRDQGDADQYLNRLNTEILERLQHSGAAFVSNAVLGDMFVLRACIVNFRTTLGDVEALPALVVRLGREADAALRGMQP